jgi:hypothetical protein
LTSRILIASALVLVNCPVVAAGSDDPSRPPFAYQRDGTIAPLCDRQAETPQAFVSIRFYDTEGKAGIVPYGYDQRLSGSLGLEDGSVYTIQLYSCPAVNVSGIGIPFWWECKNPWNGTVRGWARSSYSYSRPKAVLPAPASEVGFSIFKHAEISGLMTMGIYVSLVDKLNTPSPLISNFMAYSGRTSVVTAVYLPGNTLSETIGIESHSFDSDDLYGDRPGLLWGDYEGIGVGGADAPFVEQIPLGPILIAMSFDGSTTAMIEIDGSANTYFEADLPFAPLPGSTLPTARELLGEPPPFVLGPSLDAVMLRDSIDLTTDLDYYCDRNLDGVLDAADYLLYNRVEEQP